MFKSVTIIVLLAALLLGGALAKRTVWIHKKIAALSAPASSHYVQDNAELPPKGSRPRIVLIGDSRIARWPAVAWPENWEVINRGRGGETAAQMAQRFPFDVIALDPDVIVIETGINDLTAASFMEEDEMRAVALNTEEILLRVADQAATPGRRVLIATIIPPARPDFVRLLFWKEAQRALVAEVNTKLAQSPLPERVSVIDFSSPLVADDPQTLSDDYRLNTVHINEAGYAQLTSTLIDKVQSVIEEERNSRR